MEKHGKPIPSNLLKGSERGRVVHAPPVKGGAVNGRMTEQNFSHARKAFACLPDIVQRVRREKINVAEKRNDFARMPVCKLKDEGVLSVRAGQKPHALIAEQHGALYLVALHLAQHGGLVGLAKHEMAVAVNHAAEPPRTGRQGDPLQ